MGINGSSGHENGYHTGNGKHEDIALPNPIDTINIIGYPTAGKDTVFKRLIPELQREGVKIDVIATGKIFRKLSENSSDVAAKVRAIMRQGKLVTDDLLYELLEDELRTVKVENLLGLNGVPRTEEQMKWYTKRMSAMGREDLFIQLSLGDDPLVAKEVMRDRMNVREEAREDDNDVALKQRLEEAKKLDPVIAAARERKRLISIDALPPADMVYENVRTELRHILGNRFHASNTTATA